MEYRQYAPSPQLAPAVHRIWTLEGHASELGGALQPIVPDGRPELVIHCGDPFERVSSTTIERQPAMLFAGQLKGPLLLRPTGRIAVVGVRFHPYGAVALFGQPQSEFTDRTPGIDDVSRSLFRSLIAVRDSITSLEQLRPAIEQQLAHCVAPGHIDRRIQQAVETIQRYHGGIPVDRLAKRVGMTRRHLERQFNAQVGLAPKRLARIVRLQHALSILDRACGPETAASCGYADQAHFIRECHELSGQPPSAYLLERAQLTGFFTERA